MRRAPLGDVTEFIRDGTHGSPVRTDVGVPVLSAMNVKDGHLNFDTDRHTTDAEFEAFFRRIPLAAGDVLLTIVGTIGRAAVVQQVRPLVFQRSVAVIRPSAAALDSRFLYHVTQSVDFQVQLDRASNKSSQAGVYLGKLAEVTVPLPPLPEQRRIAAILDKADALRTKRREALAQLNRLAQSIFVEMFGDPATNAKGWPVSTLGDLLESATYGTSEKSGASGQFPVLRMNNITRTGEMDLSDLKYMDLDAAECARYLVRAGDILFNRTNSAELVGKTAIFRQPEPMAYAGYLIRLRANADNDPEYLAGFMNTPYAKRVLRGMCKSIIGMANINATEVQGIRVARPPLALQTRFRERIGSLNHVKASHRTSLAEQDRLFTSLQHRAFRGEL